MQEKRQKGGLIGVLDKDELRIFLVENGKNININQLLA
jgi:hypothetical protein